MKKLLPKYLAPYKLSLLVVVILVAIQAISNRGSVWVASLSLAMTGECAGGT